MVIPQAQGLPDFSVPKDIQKSSRFHVDVSENKGIYPQIIHFNRDVHYKSSILGYPYFWKHPCQTHSQWGYLCVDTHPLPNWCWHKKTIGFLCFHVDKLLHKAEINQIVALQIIGQYLSTTDATPNFLNEPYPTHQGPILKKIPTIPTSFNIYIHHPSPTIKKTPSPHPQKEYWRSVSKFPSCRGSCLGPLLFVIFS